MGLTGFNAARRLERERQGRETAPGDLNNCSVPKLRELAATAGIEVPKGVTKKAEIIKLLEEGRDR